VTYTATIEDCQASPQGFGARPKLRAGALLKLIDIAAGVAARRHASTSCVTISVDSVLCKCRSNTIRLLVDAELGKTIECTQSSSLYFLVT